MDTAVVKVNGAARNRKTRGQPARPDSRQIVYRHRLTLTNDVGGKCHLLHAPPGYGKSTLLRQWADELEEAGWQTIRFRVDDGPDCLERMLDQAFGCLIGRLSVKKTPAALVSAVIAALERVHKRESQVAILLDDFDAGDTSEHGSRLGAFVRQLCNSLDARFALFVASRKRPHWPVEKMQLEGGLRIIGRDQLAFDLGETQELVNRTQTGERDGYSSGQLHGAAGAWPAIIKLALEDGFDFNTEGADLLRFKRIPAYLDEVVDDLLNEQQKSFAKTCAILGSVSFELCRDLFKGDDVEPLLNRFDNELGLFEAVSGKTHWFSLNSILASHLSFKAWRDDQTGTIRLHALASTWHRDHNQPYEALRHTVAARDYSAAMELLAAHARAIVRSSRLQIVFEIVERIPQNILQRNLRVILPLIWGSLLSRRLDKAKDFIESLEQQLDYEEREPGSVELPYSMETLRAVAAVARIVMMHYDDSIGTDEKEVNSAKSKYSGVSSLLDAQILRILSDLQMAKDNLEDAFISAKESEFHFRMDDNLFGKTEAVATMAWVRLRQGHLQDARRLCEQVLTEAFDEEGPLPSAAFARLILTEIQYEQNNLLGAERELEKTQLLLLERDAPHLSIRALEIESDIRQAHGATWKGAMGPLLRAENLATDTRMPNTHNHLRDRQALCAARYGELETAQALLSQSGFDVASHTLKPTFEFGPHEEVGVFALTLLHYRLENHHLALRLAKRLLYKAELSGRRRSIARNKALIALILAALDQESEALRTIRDVVVLAQSNGLARSIIDLGTELPPLLNQFIEVRETQVHTDEVDAQISYARLLARAKSQAVLTDQTENSANGNALRQHLIHPLTNRELAILSLTAHGKRNSEIAEELLIKETTVKWHMRNLLGKMDAGNRTEAVNIARTMKLID